MRFPRNARIFRGQWDAVPFLSVFFLLVLFLALESRIAFVPGVAIDLPQGGELPAHSGVTLIVAVDHLGQLYYNNQAVPAAVFQKQLEQDIGRLGVPVTLIVHADKFVTNEKLVQLSGLAKGAGARDILLATRRTPAAEPPKAKP